MWWKRNKWKVTVPIAVLVLLALAFWYGGDAPGLHGWTVIAPPAPSVDVQLDSMTAEVTVSTYTGGAFVALSPANQAPDPAPSVSPTTAPSVQTAEAEPPTSVAHCTLSICCDTVLDHLDRLEKATRELVPADGVILSPLTVDFEPGESAFDVLRRVCQDRGIHMEFSTAPVYHSVYVEGIGNLYEFDCGELSGWMYRVNGQYHNYSASAYLLQDGDVIEWRYTCDRGEDIGDSAAVS